ncbi:uncharacterized protein LOC131658967 [Vicia villosa]|uniref:uncharacterized protein LOC131658967 n=1 Tax=Vicia villosa TaxID=3911 RepID=UPI00273CC12B|nr:uncharacterized protein LOC131658967 [Vicia villosa]
MARASPAKTAPNQVQSLNPNLYGRRSLISSSDCIETPLSKSQPVESDIVRCNHRTLSNFGRSGNDRLNMEIDKLGVGPVLGGFIPKNNETKFKEVNVELVRSLWGTEEMDFSFSVSVGSSGGLLSIWNSISVSVEASFSGPGFLGNKVLWKGEYFYVVNIYSGCALHQKRELWNSLLVLKNKFQDGEWIIAGDFNTVKKRSERWGCSSRSVNSKWSDFSDFIDDIGLVDVPCKDKRFSWISGDGKSKSRIDRFLISNNVISSWGVVGQWIGKRDISDHCPVWLMVDKEDWGPKPFKFNNEWFNHNHFFDFVKKEWDDIKFQGRGDYVLKEKLRLIKERLRWWEKNIFGKIDLEIEENVKELNKWDDRERWEEEIHLNNVKASKNIWFNLKLKENMLIQKSRMRWLNNGDENTRFFHNTVKERRRLNRICMVDSNEGVASSVNEVKETVRNHFEDKFKEDCFNRPLLEGIAFKSLSVDQACSLEAPFTLEEIREAVWSCDGSKRRCFCLFQ